MSEEFVNNWKPRKENILRFETGNACVVQKPGPELALKLAHLSHRLTALRQDADRLSAETANGQDEKIAFDVLERMTDEQKEVSFEIMCITVAACVKRPRIYAKPKFGQVGVRDIDDTEFLAVWKWHQAGCPDLPEADEGVTAADADRFPAEQAGGAGAGNLGGDVRAEAEPVAAV